MPSILTGSFHLDAQALKLFPAVDEKFTDALGRLQAGDHFVRSADTIGCVSHLRTAVDVFIRIRQSNPPLRAPLRIDLKSAGFRKAVEELYDTRLERILRPYDEKSAARDQLLQDL